MTLESIFVELYSKHLAPKDIDAGILVVTPNLVGKKPLITCQVPDVDALAHMAAGSDKNLFTPNDPEHCMFAAVYSDTSRCPLPRYYVMLAKGLLEQGKLFAALRKKGAEFDAVPPDDMGKYLAKGDPAKLMADYKKRVVNGG